MRRDSGRWSHAIDTTLRRCEDRLWAMWPNKEVKETNELKQIEEPSRKTPVMAETDVLVIGGGPGGLSAALAAAREGVDTMLVERHGCFGGVITQAMIGTIAWYRSKAETGG